MTSQVVKRERGYVVGFDVVRDQKVWKVRVSKPGSAIDGKKVVVQSVADGITIDRGMEVEFQLGQFQRGRELVLKAVDVRPYIDNPEVGTVACNVCKCDHCNEPAEILFEASLMDSEAAQYARTCLSHLGQTVGFLRTCFQERRTELRFLNIFKGDKEWRRWPNINF